LLYSSGIDASNFSFYLSFILHFDVNIFIFRKIENYIPSYTFIIAGWFAEDLCDCEEASGDCEEAPQENLEAPQENLKAP
jgi:hypothetical protein